MTESNETAAEIAEDDHQDSASRRLFDLRWLIAGLFTLYGLVLIVMGIADSAAEIHKAAGIRINLWTGVGMLILGLLFALWAWLRPLKADAPASAATQVDGTE